VQKKWYRKAAAKKTFHSLMSNIKEKQQAVYGTGTVEYNLWIYDFYCVPKE
jgi:hypothetical protein